MKSGGGGVEASAFERLLHRNKWQILGALPPGSLSA